MDCHALFTADRSLSVWPSSSDHLPQVTLERRVVGDVKEETEKMPLTCSAFSRIAHGFGALLDFTPCLERKCTNTQRPETAKDLQWKL